MWRTSGCANTAWSEAIVMSAASWYQKPPPIAQPLTAAMIGLPSRHMCAQSAARSPSWRCQNSMKSDERLALRIGMARAGRVGLSLVVAGAECAARAGEDDDADGAVAVRLVEGAMQFVFKVVRERIHPVWPVQRDGRDAVFDGVEEVLGAHPIPFFWFSGLFGGIGDGIHFCWLGRFDRDIDRDRAR